jgi:hypothetical protein
VIAAVVERSDSCPALSTRLLAGNGGSADNPLGPIATAVNQHLTFATPNFLV